MLAHTHHNSTNVMVCDTYTPEFAANRHTEQQTEKKPQNLNRKSLVGRWQNGY